MGKMPCNTYSGTLDPAAAAAMPQPEFLKVEAKQMQEHGHRSQPAASKPSSQDLQDTEPRVGAESRDQSVATSPAGQQPGMPVLSDLEQLLNSAEREGKQQPATSESGAEEDASRFKRKRRQPGSNVVLPDLRQTFQDDDAAWYCLVPLVMLSEASDEVRPHSHSLHPQPVAHLCNLIIVGP